MRIRDTSTPVLVLECVAHGGLGILRSLGRLGVGVYALDANPWTPGFFSRYCRRHFRYDLDSGPENRSVEYVLDAGQKIGRRSILISTTDEAATLVADHADVLREWFIFPDQRVELVHSLCSKKEMYHLAKKFGIATAESLFPQSRADVLEFLKSATLPIVLKGIDGKRLWKRAGKRMFIVRSASELLEKYDTMEDSENPNLMLQEYIPGGDDSVWMFNGYFNERSECLVGFTGKKIRQCPVYSGVTSLGICLKNETVERMTKDFMKTIGYKGVLDIGYRYDARDGLYKVLDVNPRIGGTFRLFVADNGMDVARALYLDLTRQRVVPCSAPEGRKWIVEDLDLASCLRYCRDGKLSLKEWIGSFRGIREAGYFALDDLLPLLPMCVSRVGELIRRIYSSVPQRIGRAKSSALSPSGPSVTSSRASSLKHRNDSRER